MDGQEQAQGGGYNETEEVAKLFQNVGQGLVLVNQYIAKAQPDAQGMAQEILQGFEQLVQAIQGGGQGQGQSQPMPQEAGAARVQQSY